MPYFCILALYSCFLTHFKALHFKVLKQYKEKTGCSVIVNTSFNVRGEPIVNDEIDAFRCFMETDMDYVVIGNRLFDKNCQNKILYETKNRKRRKYKLD